VDTPKLAPQSPSEIEKLVSLVRSISDFGKMSGAEQDGLIADLLDFECYSQTIKLLEWRSKRPEQSFDQKFADYRELMRIYYCGLEDFEKFIECAKLCTKQLSPTFAMIRMQIAEDILGPSHFEEHAKLYTAVWPDLADPIQQVLLLTRLALIKEKKLFRENDVEPIYAAILRIDPHNIRALRFYRMWHGQVGEWTQAAGYLTTLLKAYKNPNEKQRAAHELAQIHLYNLNQPERAKQILLAHCAESHLDTRQTLVEALERLDAYDELLECLDDMRAKAEDPSEVVAILLKKGQTLHTLGRYPEAEKNLRACVVLDPDNLLIHEAYVTSLISASKPAALRAALIDMAAHCKQPEGRQRLSNLAVSLNDLYAGDLPEQFTLPA
jgi:tetratricopeptide (TPR) repeat protein